MLLLSNCGFSRKAFLQKMGMSSNSFVHVPGSFDCLSANSTFAHTISCINHLLAPTVPWTSNSSVNFKNLLFEAEKFISPTAKVHSCGLSQPSVFPQDFPTNFFDDDAVASQMREVNTCLWPPTMEAVNCLHSERRQ